MARYLRREQRGFRVLSLFELGWSGSTAYLKDILLGAVPPGIATYVGDLAAAWVLAGRPNGKEISYVRAAARIRHGRPNLRRRPWPFRRPH